MPELSPDLLGTWLARSSSGSREREQAIRDAAGVLAGGKPQQLLDLVALAHAVPDHDAAARVRDAVGEHDPQFRGRPNDRQTQVAAAWAVAHAICGDDSTAALLASLATASAKFSGLDARGPGLPVLAGDRLVELGEEHRARHKLAVNMTVPKVLADLEPAAFDPTVFVEAVRGAARTLAARMDTVVKQADQRLRAADEELDLLWWTVRRRRDGAGTAWADLGAGAAILAGQDMGSLTTFASPIASAEALLAEALADVKPTTLGAAIDAAADPARLPGSAPQHRLLPVTTALTLRRSDPNGWRKAPVLDGLALSARHSAVHLADQVVREELMRRLL